MIFPAQSEHRHSRRTSRSVTVVSASLLVVALAGCSSSSSTDKTGGTTSTPPPSTPASAPAVSTPASTPTSTPAGAAPSVAPAPAPASAAPADPATKKAVSTTYESFFTPNTSPAVAQAELQNGTQFTSSLAALAKTAKAQKTSVKVSAVSVAGPVATVTFTLFGGKAPLLPDTHGFAVLVNGKWQVAAQTFCALVGLQGPAPAACKEPKYTALPR